MKSKIVQGVLILGMFIVFIVQQPMELPDSFNKMYYGIFHPSSFIFIFLTAIVFYLSIEQDIKKAKNEHQDKEAGIREAIKTFENFFNNELTLNDVFNKSKNNQTIFRVLRIANYGGTEDDLSLAINKEFTNIASKYIKLKSEYDYIATVLPIIGMIGTIAGLLIMFGIPEDVEDFADKFVGLSIALATTLYASLFTVLVFKPLARSIEQWLVNLDTDNEYCDIAVKQFFHKMNMMELRDLFEENIEKAESKEAS